MAPISQLGRDNLDHQGRHRGLFWEAKQATRKPAFSTLAQLLPSMWSVLWHGSMAMNWLRRGFLPSKDFVTQLKKVSRECQKWARANL